MKKIINFALALLIFWCASHWFGDYVQIDGIEGLILTTLIWWISGYAIMAICILCLVPALAGNFGKVVAMAAIVTIIIFSSVIRLYLMQRFYSGFAINGGWTYILLALTLSIFSLGEKKKD